MPIKKTPPWTSWGFSNADGTVRVGYAGNSSTGSGGSLAFPSTLGTLSNSPGGGYLDASLVMFIAG